VEHPYLAKARPVNMQASLDKAEQALLTQYWSLSKQDVQHWTPDMIANQLAIRRAWLEALRKKSGQQVPKNRYVTIPNLRITVSAHRIQAQVTDLERMLGEKSKNDRTVDVPRLQVSVNTQAQRYYIQIHTTDSGWLIAQMKERTIPQLMEQLEIRFNWLQEIRRCHYTRQVDLLNLHISVYAPGRLETQMSMEKLRKDINDILVFLRLRSMYDESTVITRGHAFQPKPTKLGRASRGSLQKTALHDYCQYLTDTGPWFNCLYQAWRLCDYLRTELIQDSYQLPVLSVPTQSRQSTQTPPSGSHLRNQVYTTAGGITTFRRGAQPFLAYPGVFSDVWLI
jgi:hypothetical protein